MPLNLIQPPGARSLRSREAAGVMAAQHWLADWFQILGGDPVIPSTLVSYSNDSDWLGQKGGERIRLIDRSTGDVVSLRADLTTQILHQENLESPRSLFAVGPVFRETVNRPDQPRESWQATLEHLRVDLWPDTMPDPFALIVAAAVQVAQSWLDSRWQILVGNAGQLPAGDSQKRYLTAENLSSGWYNLPCWEGEQAERVMGLSGISASRLRLNEHLAAPRLYYSGWYFQLFHPDSNRPLMAGGLYRSNRSKGVHAGFGVDLEALALDAARLVPDVVGCCGSVRLGDPVPASLLRALWQHGVAIREDAHRQLCGGTAWQCVSDDDTTQLGEDAQDVSRNLQLILQQGA